MEAPRTLQTTGAFRRIKETDSEHRKVVFCTCFCKCNLRVYGIDRPPKSGSETVREQVRTSYLLSPSSRCGLGRITSRLLRANQISEILSSPTVI